MKQFSDKSRTGALVGRYKLSVNGSQGQMLDARYWTLERQLTADTQTAQTMQSVDPTTLWLRHDKSDRPNTRHAYEVFMAALIL